MRVKDLINESQQLSELKVGQGLGKTIQAAPGKMKQTFQSGTAAASAAANKAGIGGGLKKAISSFKKGYAQGSGTAAPADIETPPAAASDAAPAEPAAAVKPNAAEFAQKLQGMFDEFVKANGSIGAPAVKQVIKNMWMQAGGIRAESKKFNKK